jgi:hypothetical protein
LSIRAWNVQRGIRNKLSDPEFLQIIKDCDIGFYSECWLPEGFCADSFSLEGFKTVPVQRQKCRGGGLLLIYRENISHKITIDKICQDSIVWVTIDKTCFSDMTGLFLCCCYIPDEGSVFYDKYGCDIYELILSDMESYSKLGNIALIGDTNSRVGTIHDAIDDDQLSRHVLDGMESLFSYPHEPSTQKRKTMDSRVNTLGRQLI